MEKIVYIVKVLFFYKEIADLYDLPFNYVIMSYE
jgi:hypothetical protein